MRTKHAEKTRVGLWGQSVNPERTMGRYKWYQSIPLLVRCGSGTNPTEVGGHVTPETEMGGEYPRPMRAKSGCRCMRHDNETLLAASRRKPNSHRNERDPEAVQV